MNKKKAKASKPQPRTAADVLAEIETKVAELDRLINAKERRGVHVVVFYANGEEVGTTPARVVDYKGQVEVHAGPWYPRKHIMLDKVEVWSLGNKFNYASGENDAVREGFPIRLNLPTWRTLYPDDNVVYGDGYEGT